jgi:hypothetical protein
MAMSRFARNQHSPENKKGEDRFFFTFLRREISPAKV